jgi:hypothetical protein
MPTAYHCYYTDTWKKHFCLYGSRAYYLVILCQQHIILTECRPTANYMTSICKQNIVVLYMPTAYCLAVCVRSLLFLSVCVNSILVWFDSRYIYQQHTTLLFRMTACVSQELLQIRSFAYNTPYYVDSRVNSILPGQFAATGTSVEYLSIWFGYVKEIYFEKCVMSIILATCRHCLKHITVTLFLYVSTELLFDNTKGRKYLAL